MSKSDDSTEEDIEKLFEAQLKKTKAKKHHRGYGDYERKGIYRGVKINSKSKK
ncbi:hypothetical protein [Methanosalsum natronophilum]|uniref:hypothetical protein n=1 Tax=Methanosalsum natronophilum TaxID=768733 RepID=UPI002168AE33|nr:hypothetical protein [Methanosalsum natronophilum]MCS3924398.1 hypothetical protein [Methanosalsum natronophilum]